MNQNESMAASSPSFSPSPSLERNPQVAAELAFSGGPLAWRHTQRRAAGRWSVVSTLLFHLALPLVAAAPTAALADVVPSGQGEGTSSTNGEPSGSDALTEAQTEEARQAFLEGRELMKEERWAAAAQAFLRAFEIRPTPGLQYYVGYCWEQAGRLVEARASYVAAGELAQELPAADVERLLPDAIARTEGGLGKLELQGAPAGARLLVDGTEQPASGDLWLLPGQHELRVAATGYVPREFLLRVSRGHAERVDLALQPERAASATSVPTEAVASTPYDSATSGHHPAFLPALLGGGTLAVVGLAAGVSGTVVALGAADDVRTYQDQVDGLGGCGGAPQGALATACDNLSLAANNQLTATAVAVGGYAAAVVGSTFVVLGLTVWNRQNVQVGALPLNEGGGILVSGRF